MTRRLFTLAAIIFAALTFASCAANDNFTYWDITKKVSGDNSALEYYAVLSLSDITEENILSEIWINVGELSQDEATFNVKFGSDKADSNLKYGAKTDIKVKKDVAAKTGGWVKICADLNYTYNYALITTCDTMHFNEIVFLTNDRQKIKISVVYAGERSPDNHNIKREYDFTSSDDSASGDNLADKIADEQDKFSFDTISALYENAIAE